MFSVDGVEFSFPCDIDRTAEIRGSSLSGMLLDRTYYNDVLGTYMQYTVTLAVPLNKMAEYADLYELLSAPEEGHDFQFPYNGGTLSFRGRIGTVSDRYMGKIGSDQIWRGTRFTVIANTPREVSE